MNKPTLYLGITTTRDQGPSWESKIREIDKLGIEEAAVFLTGLEREDRNRLCEQLKRTGLRRVPFVHLRHDSTVEEMEFFRKYYQTKLFNIHAAEESLEFYLSVPEHSTEIFLENIEELRDIFFDNLPKFAGICFDVAHLEDFGYRSNNRGYDKLPDLLKLYKVGFAHISGVRPERELAFGNMLYSTHFYKNLSDFDYLKKYRTMLPEVMALELENSLEEQNKAKEYIETII